MVASEEWYDKNGLLHKLDGPALIERHRERGFITRRGFYLKNVLHRENGLPASEYFDVENGNLVRRSWLLEGEFYRQDDLPHVETLDPDTGIVIRAEYGVLSPDKREFILHRENGPARIEFDRLSGIQKNVLFYLHGRRIDRSHNPFINL